MVSANGLCHVPAIVVFLRHPTPGRVKTRLARDVGDAGAALFYRQCAEKAIIECVGVAGAACYIFFASADEEEAVRRWLQPLHSGLHYLAQLQSPVLGARLAHALQHVLSLGHPAAAVVGTDVPDLSSSIVQAAMSSLAEHEVVFGPAEDGGYYLIGLRARAATPGLFDGVPWSTATVLRHSAANARRLGLDIAPSATLPTLPDVDTKADLERWAAAARKADRGAPHALLATAEEVLKCSNTPE